MKRLIETITCVSLLTPNHVTTAGHFPVLPRHHGSFELKPHNFFDRNPALDLRRAPFEVAP